MNKLRNDVKKSSKDPELEMSVEEESLEFSSSRIFFWMILFIGEFTFLVFWYWFSGANLDAKFKEFQDLAISLSSFLIAGTAIILAWASINLQHYPKHISKRISFSIVSCIGWFFFLILWFFFFAREVDPDQTIRIFLISLFIIVGLNGILWTSILREEDPILLMWKFSISVITSIAWLGVVILWLFFYAEDLNTYQNLTLSIVLILTIMGINSIIRIIALNENIGRR